MNNILAELKEIYKIKGIKAEFEDEGLSFDDMLSLQKGSRELNADFVVKIGGAGAVNDIKNSKELNVSGIIAPMVESKYALKKFTKSVKNVYESEKPNLYINIETKTGLNSLDEILNCEEAEYLKGIVLGRSDMMRSFEYAFNADSDNMLDIARHISKKAKEKNLEFIVGGGITPYSLIFLKNLGEENFDYFETRKIIFHSNSVRNKDIKRGIICALGFEVEWLKTLRNPIEPELIRIKKIEDMIKKIPTFL